MNRTRSASRSLSQICVEVIADLAAQTGTPTVRQIMTATGRHVGARDTIPAQVRTQVVAGIAANYFRLYAPGQGWRFAGDDHSLAAAPSQLVWTHPDGSALIDAILAEDRPSLTTRISAAERLRDRATPAYGATAQLRVLVPRSPDLSCLVRPGAGSRAA